jgi:thioredoxin 2
MVSPALEQLARDLAGKVKLVKVNVDISPQIWQRFRGQAIPALLVFRHGQVAARQTGAVPLATLRTWVGNAPGGGRRAHRCHSGCPGTRGQTR